MKGILIIFVIFLFFMGCMNERDENMDIDLNQLRSAVEKIQKKRIYFGHQSVGKNIMQGIRDLLEAYDLTLNIVTVTDSSRKEFPETFFADDRIGQNNFPITKCEDLEKRIGLLFNGQIDIALLKFCYVDIKEHSDVEQIFQDYVAWVEHFKQKYPNIIFVHMTVPVMSSSGGWKIHIKRLIGYPDFTDPANIKRNYFNEMLLNKYKDDPVFDIAKLEATHFNGELNTFKKSGKTYYSLIRDYTYDGGHLNELGRKWIAYHLLLFLGEIASDIN